MYARDTNIISPPSRLVQSSYLDLRIELIEVPPFDNSVMRRDAQADMVCRDVGAYHISVDASLATLSLRSLLTSWNDESKRRYKRSLAVVVRPELKRIGGELVEVAMVTDADGNMIEVMRSAWEAEDAGAPTGGAGGSRDGAARFEWKDDGVLRSDVL